MEDPLLREESSTREIHGGATRKRRKGYRGRLDAISYGSVYQRAAALVDLVSSL